ncbi:TMAO reductase system periplasmic protein TorT [Edwardsiella piscicida]|uniref:TMAO reductase system periplasmic protein TorT n=1 Tax=Edwardsiella piscicida TaxID=1263550 RepID=UPI00370D5495
MSRRRTLFLCLLWLSTATAHADAPLLRWPSDRQSVQLRQPPLHAVKRWKLCALYPSLKDAYWLSINDGMIRAADRLGVTLKVFEAGGYRQQATQREQMALCRDWGADAILIGSSTARFPALATLAAGIPLIEVVNALHDPAIRTRIGVPWFQMGYQPGRYLAQRLGQRPLKVLLMPGPRDAGGSREMSDGFKAALSGSRLQIVDVAYGDNDIEVQRNLLQDMLERHPDIDVVAGTAIAAEVAMGEGRNRATPLTIVSFYLSHQVYRGLKRGRILAAASDQMVWQGELAVEQALRTLQGERVPDNVSPPILVLTQRNVSSALVRRSLSPLGFRPVYLYQPAPKAE